MAWTDRVWRWTGEGRDFVAVLGRRPAIRVDVDVAAGLPFARMLITVPDPDATVAAVLGATAPR